MPEDYAGDVDHSVKLVLAGTRSQNIHNKQLFIHSLHLPGQAARMQPLNQTASSCRMTSQILFGPSQQDRIVPSANSEDTPPAHHRHQHNSRSYSRQVNEHIVANSMHCRAQHLHLHNSYQKKIGRRRLREVGSEDKGRRSESKRQPITSAVSHAYKDGPIFISNYMQLLAITLGLLSLLSQLKSVIGQQQQQQLPTVIVRGFLNYRTTVDGTVLLFTPDAGQQQQQPAASTIQSSPPAYLETSATNEPAIAATATYFTAPPKSIMNMASSSAGQIEPTSVPLAPISSHTASGAGGDDNYDRQSPIAEAVADTAQADQWRPIQATPPLRSASSRRGSASSMEDGASNNSGEPSSKPAVQADDIVTAGGGPAGNVATSATATSAKESDSGRNASPASKPKRPTFSQGSRAGAALQSRFRQTGDGSSSNSINGIRRPGLANGLGDQHSPASSTTSAPNVQSSSEPSAQAANAFQSRLASANARMRNRLKHKQHLFGNSGAGSGHNNTSSSGSNNNNSPQASALSSLAPSDGTLDVASSIEQPTSSSAGAAAAAVGTSDQGATGTGGEPIAAWSPLQAAATSSGASFRPAVGSDEILVSAANGGDQPGSGPDSETAAGANGSSKTEPDLGLEPLSPEQEAGLRPLSRSGELRPSSSREVHGGGGDEQPKLLRGQLQHGALSSGPLNLDALFQSDQPSVSSSTANSGQQQQATDAGDHSDSKPGASGLVRPNGSALGKPRPMSHNDKLNGWLGTHHNKFVPRPAPKQHGEAAGSSLSRQLAANLNQLSPSFSVPHISPTSISMSGSGGSSSSISLSATPILQVTATSIATNGADSALAANGSSDYATAALDPAGSTPIPVAHPDSQADGIDSPSSSSGGNVSMQTITRTYSTVMTTSKTRLVPLQVKSSTAIYTITEDYVMTKMMTAYQTMPAGEFILPEAPNVSAFDVFADDKRAPSDTSAKSEQHQAAAAAAAGSGASGAPFESQEQPISLDTSSSPSSSSSSSSKSAANNWLHDFSNPGQDTGASQLSLGEPAADPFQQSSQQQQQAAVLALLEQQARDTNLAGSFPGPGETLDQLASQLDPAALLADGAINIPDLNNPLVLAAAIQNPQLAAVILAAQQLKLKQRQNKFIQQQQQSNLNNQQQQLHNQLQQPQVTYSTSYSTTIRPSTYTARDTMYTTRLVSFRDGRTVRTRTVSEPGSVIEQVLTTTVTERVPITITIKPTGVIMPLAAPTAAPSLASAAAAATNSNQATINNALFASQLASILARRQHQLQTSFSNPALMGLGGTNSGLTATSGLQANQAATPQQLQAMQQLFNQQKRQQSQQLQHQQNQQQQQAQATAPVAANQFQPNLQQLLQNMQQQQQTQSQPTNSASQNASPTSQSAAQQGSHQNNGNQNGDSSSRQQQDNGSSKLGPVGSGQFQATPSLPVIPKSIDGSPITTTLTSLQVRTYTVHNAFKTIFRTITSTVLIPTVLASG